MRRAIFPFLCLLICLTLIGCSRHPAKWLHGKWVFDQEYTREQLAKESAQPTGESKGIIGGLKELAEGLVTPQLVNALEGTRLNVTDTELIITGKDGNGKAIGYEVVESPTPDSLTLKQDDGEVTTYHREGERFWTKSTGTLNVRAYFRRAQ